MHATPTAAHDAAERVDAAIRFLHAQRGRPVRLADLAAGVGLSEFHFQRLFTHWAGISPKRFAQMLTLDDARVLLRTDASLLQAACTLGLSGPSRLHDLFVTLDAATPGEYKRGGAGVDIAVGQHDGPFGRFLLGVTDRGVCWLSFVDGPGTRDPVTDLRRTWPAARVHEDHSRTGRVAKRIFATRRSHTGAPLPVLVRGTNFQVKVWEALLRIPAGGLATYSDVAAAIGKPTASRAVGNAVGSNPVSFIIPCHRVIRSLGILGNYGGGVPRKAAMIAWEAARYADVAAAL